MSSSNSSSSDYFLYVQSMTEAHNKRTVSYTHTQQHNSVLQSARVQMCDTASCNSATALATQTDMHTDASLSVERNYNERAVLKEAASCTAAVRRCDGATLAIESSIKVAYVTTSGSHTRAQPAPVRCCNFRTRATVTNGLKTVSNSY
eukprot:2601-Heterococcus_DN1.PRE.1